MPQNHRTFLYLSVESIADLPPSLSAVYPLYFSLFSLPRPMSAQSPSIPSFSCSFVCLRKSSLPSLHLPPPHPSLFLPSPSRPFPSLIDMFPFSKLLSLHHIHSFFYGHFSFSLFRSLLPHALWVNLTSVLSAFPGGLYFTQPARPQVGMAVLVRAVDWVEAAWDSVLRARQNGAARGEMSLCSKLNFYSCVAIKATEEKQDKQRKKMYEITLVHFTKQSPHIYLTCWLFL